MIISLFYVILAALGLGIIVFVHELGHYFMARHVGMKVEAFGIGFGKPIHSWEWKGVKWNLCWIPFGGYVRIAGMEKDGKIEPYLIPNGFFGKKPIDRIKVALTGPVVNLLFGLLLFGIIWVAGGREKPFAEFTRFIGWVDPGSILYESEVRPGDEILKINGRDYHGFRDLAYAAILDHGPSHLQGDAIDYPSLRETPFNFVLSKQEEPFALLRMMTPAKFLIYDRSGSSTLNTLPEGSPMKESGILDNDQILWVDGVFVFSFEQLSSAINESKALLTVRRGDDLFLCRVPKMKIADLRIGQEQKNELEDWQHEAGIRGKSSQNLFIPYNVNQQGVIVAPLHFIDENATTMMPEEKKRSPITCPLMKGDRIIAVDGVSVSSSYDLMRELQTKHLQIIVKRGSSLPNVSWKDADALFEKRFVEEDFAAITKTIGTDQLLTHAGDLYLLNPVTPKPIADLPLSEKLRTLQTEKFASQRKVIEEIQDPEQREAALHRFEESQKKLYLGVSLKDQEVIYNPSPFYLFSGIFTDTCKTLAALFAGNASPKMLSGPIGIVQVMQHGWSVGFKEALFWMAMVSVNLGFLNLLPIPVLDGGHILFSLVEMVTKKPMKAKTMERLVIPFLVLLVAFFIFATYHDISRILKGFFR